MFPPIEVRFIYLYDIDLHILHIVFQIRDIMNSISSVDKMDLDYTQRHFNEPSPCHGEAVKHIGDGDSCKHVRDGDKYGGNEDIDTHRWKRKYKHRHKDIADDVLGGDLSDGASMLPSESTV